MDAAALAAALRAPAPAPAPLAVTLGGAAWSCAADPDLPGRLLAALDDPAVHDLVIFGSQARGSTTGFSDVDAVLVLDEARLAGAADLRRLRGRVLAAQRAVVAHQPIQHHAFEVVGRRMLAQAGECLAMPAEALAVSRSLRGVATEARFPAAPDAAAARVVLVRMSGILSAMAAWPAHPWRLHGAVSMFELLPVLHLQAAGAPCAKWESYDRARPAFGDAWWPFDVLRDVRERWPRRPRPVVAAATALARNPWAVIAAWARLPVRAPREVSALLTPDCLSGLQRLAREMAAS
jgi:hypothetical protein